MSEHHITKEPQYTYTQNRELSWLHFNQRVLEEAADASLPAIERLKFISIFSSNLDEFFMVRAGSLFDLQEVCPTEPDSRSGLTPAQQLEKIYQAVPGLIDLKKKIYAEVSKELTRQWVFDLPFQQLTEKERKYIKRYYRSNVLPIISPIIIGRHHPVPHLNNKGLYLAALLQDSQKRSAVGLIPIPDTLPPYVQLPSADSVRLIRMETILLHWAATLFGSYTMLECCITCVTRNADLSFDDDKFEDKAVDFRSHVTSLLKNRDHLRVIRLELSTDVSELFLARLAKLVHVDRPQIFIDPTPLNMKYVFQLEDLLTPEMKQHLLYAPYTPRWPEDIDPNYSIIDQIRQHDKLLFFPYDSTEPFLKLLAEAAERPDVVSIKITIYRLASSSKIARLLCRAAENGKQVIVMMELRARFDEANNIQWSKLLESAGCQVIYGIEDYKCHSKICQITLRSKGRLSYITQIGTGNYNEKTSTMYTDLTLMTAHEEIGEDATLFFQNMLVNNLNGTYKHLLLSPNGIERAVCSLIDEECKKGDDGYICIKINSFTDREVIEKLVRASQAGVTVQLIIRGICCILPGVIHYTEHIHVTSIVGRYLEHARIYCFGRGDEAKFFISSADFMGRNLHHRVEIACPVYDPEIRDQLRWILETQLSDTEKASSVTFNGLYRRKKGDSSNICNSQQQFMDGTIHKLEPYTPAKPGFKHQLAEFFLRLLNQ